MCVIPQKNHPGSLFLKHIYKLNYLKIMDYLSNQVDIWWEVQISIEINIFYIEEKNAAMLYKLCIYYFSSMKISFDEIRLRGS
jgi:hypothetical protein